MSVNCTTRARHATSLAAPGRQRFEWDALRYPAAEVKRGCLSLRSSHAVCTLLQVRYSCGEGSKDLIVSIKVFAIIVVRSQLLWMLVHTHIALLALRDSSNIDLQEPSTCHYVMSVRTPRVCPHPEFTIEQLPVSHILCSAMPVQLGADQKVRRQKLTAFTIPWRQIPASKEQFCQACMKDLLCATSMQAGAEQIDHDESGDQQQGDEAAAQAAVEPTASATSGGQQQGDEAAAQDVGMGDGDADDLETDESPGIQPGGSPADPEWQPDSRPASDEQSEDARTQKSAEGSAVHEAAGDGSPDAAPVVQHDEL